MSGECWTWTAARLPFGYGEFRLDGRPVRAHRLAWEWEHGPIPPGLCVLHRCDRPECVRPSHLWLGTKAENTADMKAKGRGRFADHLKVRQHCPRGHAYDEANTYRRATGTRGCKACRVQATREWRARSHVKQNATLAGHIDRA